MGWDRVLVCLFVCFWLGVETWMGGAGGGGGVR